MNARNLMTIMSLSKKLMILLVVVGVMPSMALAVSVLDYGADNTGDPNKASDNKSAFDSAIVAAGNNGTVTMPAGTYYFSSSVSFDVNGTQYENVTFSGYGAAWKRILTGTDPLSLLIPGTDWTIEGITFDGSRDSDSPNYSFGVRIQYGDAYDIHGVTVQDCNFKNIPYEGLLVDDGAYDVVVSNCVAHNCYRNGMAVIDGHSVYFYNCTVYDNGTPHGIDFEPDDRDVYDFLVKDCNFVNGDSLGIWGASYGIWDVTVEGCHFTADANRWVTGIIAQRCIVDVNSCVFDANSGLHLNGYNLSQSNYGNISLSNYTGLDSSTTNLISNGDFETWSGGAPNDWSESTGGNSAIDSAGTRGATSGSYGMHLDSPDSGCTGYVTQEVSSISANSWYTFSGYIWQRPSVVRTPMIKLQVRNSADSVLRTITLFTNKKDVYEKVMAIFETPANTDNILITVGQESSGVSYGYFDNLKLVAGKGPDGGDDTADYQLFDCDDKDDVKTYRMYTSITRDDVYDANVGYGFVTSGSLTDSHESSLDAVGNDERFYDVIYVPSWWDYFRVDVEPNQDYYVTVSTGVPGYYSWGYMKIQGTEYLWADNPADANSIPSPNDGTIKIIDVYNDRLRLLVPENSDANEVLTTAGEWHTGSYCNIRVYGWNNNGDYYNQGYFYNDAHRAEFLYLEKILIDANSLNYDTVEDLYYLEIGNRSGGSQGGGFATIKVQPVP
ncbi:MAG: right-handed parallel beta-helix repeat-containing protein [Planctomycetota bacterium]